MTVEADADTLFYFRFRGIADMAGHAARLVPVENDPERIVAQLGHVATAPPSNVMNSRRFN